LQEAISIKEEKMSDTNSTVNQGGKILGKDEKVPFTYPEGFNAVADSLQFLPEEARIPILATLAQYFIMQ
jgi:hypothetical protein